jgi:hypothetical protein
MPDIGRDVAVSRGGEQFTFNNRGSSTCQVTCPVLAGDDGQPGHMITFLGGESKLVTVISSATPGVYGYSHTCHSGMGITDNPKIIITG